MMMAVNLFIVFIATQMIMGIAIPILLIIFVGKDKTIPPGTGLSIGIVATIIAGFLTLAVGLSNYL